MIPKIKTVKANEDFTLNVVFEDGKTVLYDVSNDIDTIPEFNVLKTECGLFRNFEIDESRTVISWSDRVDLPSDTIYEYGIKA